MWGDFIVLMPSEIVGKSSFSQPRIHPALRRGFFQALSRFEQVVVFMQA